MNTKHLLHFFIFSTTLLLNAQERKQIEIEYAPYMEPWLEMYKFKPSQFVFVPGLVMNYYKRPQLQKFVKNTSQYVYYKSFRRTI